MNAYDVDDLIILEATFISDPVTVTVDAPGALAAATSIPVLALTGAIPSGTVLDFDTPTTATLTSTANAGATTLSVAALDDPVLAGDVAEYPGGPTDPTTVTFQIQPQGEDATVYEYGTDIELTSASVGAYSAFWLIVTPGFHEYRFIGTGEVQQAQGARFYARPSNVLVTP